MPQYEKTEDAEKAQAERYEAEKNLDGLVRLDQRALDVKADGQPTRKVKEKVEAAEMHNDMLKDRWGDKIPGTAERNAMEYDERVKRALDEGKSPDVEKDSSPVAAYANKYAASQKFAADYDKRKATDDSPETHNAEVKAAAPEADGAASPDAMSVESLPDAPAKAPKNKM